MDGLDNNFPMSPSSEYNSRHSQQSLDTDDLETDSEIAQNTQFNTIRAAARNSISSYMKWIPCVLCFCHHCCIRDPLTQIRPSDTLSVSSVQCIDSPEASMPKLEEGSPPSPLEEFNNIFPEPSRNKKLVRHGTSILRTAKKEIKLKQLRRASVSFNHQVHVRNIDVVKLTLEQRRKSIRERSQAFERERKRLRNKVIKKRRGSMFT